MRWLREIARRWRQRGVVYGRSPVADVQDIQAGARAAIRDMTLVDVERGHWWWAYLRENGKINVVRYRLGPSEVAMLKATDHGEGVEGEPVARCVSIPFRCDTALGALAIAQSKLRPDEASGAN